MNPPPIKACLFDMDGLLLNTEDLITTCVNVILREYGKPDLPWSVKARIQGRTADESNRIFQGWAQLPIGMDEFKTKLRAIHKRIFPTSEPLPGVPELLDSLDSVPGISLALATSSARPEFEIKSAGQHSLFKCFSEDCRVLGDDPRVEHHKPAPDIYLQALQCVNDRRARDNEQGPIDAGQCLVFEDSIQGVDAGRRAGMQIVWCPHRGLLEELLQGDVANDDVRDNVRTVFGIRPETPIRGLEIPAFAECVHEATNGWIQLLITLEDFPFARYALTV